MEMKNKEEFKRYLSSLKELGFGSNGVTYYDAKRSKVIKVSHDYLTEGISYYSEDILAFKDCRNNTYIFADDNIVIDDKIVAYTMPFAPGKPLYMTNPLRIKYDNFMNAVINSMTDVEKISNYGVESFDVIYNMMYSSKKLSIIDQDEYSLSKMKMEDSDLLKYNFYQFNTSVMLFLVDSFFDNFVNNNKSLHEMYNSKDVNIKEFLILFKKSLSEYASKEIVTLNDAKGALDKRRIEKKYIRDIRCI